MCSSGTQHSYSSSLLSPVERATEQSQRGVEVIRMTSAASDDRTSNKALASRFSRVLVGVDGSDEAVEAAKQAAL